MNPERRQPDVIGDLRSTTAPAGLRGARLGVVLGGLAIGAWLVGSALALEALGRALSESGTHAPTTRFVIGAFAGWAVAGIGGSTAIAVGLRDRRASRRLRGFCVGIGVLAVLLALAPISLAFV